MEVHGVFLVLGALAGTKVCIFSEQILTLSFCSSNFCVLSVVSTLLKIHFYMCLCVPFPASSARATSHFSPPLLLSGPLSHLDFSYCDL